MSAKRNAPGATGALDDQQGGGSKSIVTHLGPAGRDRPGEWPVAEPTQLDEPSQAEQRHAALAGMRREQARFHITIATIRGALREQPSERAARAAARRWHAAITAATDEAVTHIRNGRAA